MTVLFWWTFALLILTAWIYCPLRPSIYISISLFFQNVPSTPTQPPPRQENIDIDMLCCLKKPGTSNHVFSEIDSHPPTGSPQQIHGRLLQQLLGYIPWCHQKVQGVAKDPSNKTTSASWESSKRYESRRNSPVFGVRRFVFGKFLGFSPIPVLYSHTTPTKNPLKYGNGMGVVWECRSPRKFLIKLTKTPLKSRASKTIVSFWVLACVSGAQLQRRREKNPSEVQLR